MTREWTRCFGPPEDDPTPTNATVHPFHEGASRGAAFQGAGASTRLVIMAKFRKSRHETKSDSLSKYPTKSDREKHTITVGGHIDNDNKLIYLGGGLEKRSSDAVGDVCSFDSEPNFEMKK